LVICDRTHAAEKRSRKWRPQFAPRAGVVSFALRKRKGETVVSEGAPPQWKPKEEAAN
jgi:hypothetical protein